MMKLITKIRQFPKSLLTIVVHSYNLIQRLISNLEPSYRYEKELVDQNTKGIQLPINFFINNLIKLVATNKKSHWISFQLEIENDALLMVHPAVLGAHVAQFLPIWTRKCPLLLPLGEEIHVWAYMFRTIVPLLKYFPFSPPGMNYTRKNKYGECVAPKLFPPKEVVRSMEWYPLSVKQLQHCLGEMVWKVSDCWHSKRHECQVVVVDVARMHYHQWVPKSCMVFTPNDVTYDVVP